jgi:hypothetical protein
LRWGTITSDRAAGMAVRSGTGPRGLEEEAEGRPSLYSTIGPSSGLKLTRPSDRNLAKMSAASGSVKKVSGGGVVIYFSEVTLVPNVLEPGTVIDEMHHVAWCSAAGAEV